MRAILPIALCCLLAGGAMAQRRGGGGGFHGAGGRIGGGVRIGGSGGGARGFNGGFRGAFRRGFESFRGYGNRGFYGFGGYSYWPYLYPSFGYDDYYPYSSYSTYVSSYYPYVSDYGYGYYSPYSYSYPSVYQPNVTVVYPPAQEPSTVTVQRAEPVMRRYDQYGQEIKPSAQSGASPLYLIAFNDQIIRAAIAYWADGDTLHYVTPQHEEKTAPLSAVDRDMSRRLNRERGVNFQLSQQ